MTHSDKNLVLSWTNYDQKLTNAFRKFLDTEQFCNITLSAEGKSIKCHQEILSACSDWFERILTPLCHQHPIIIFKEVNFKELDYIVKFMYSGETIVPQKDLQTFLKTAEMLEMNSLIRTYEDSSETKNEIMSPDKVTNEPLDSELTVTTKKPWKKDSNSLCNLVFYNQMNINNHAKAPKSNPLIKAYEANKRKTEEQTSTSTSKHSEVKISRHYEADAPVFDNRHIDSSLDVVQSQVEYSDDYDGDVMDDPPPASGIEDCGPFKKIWSYRYLCYNLGKEILCLLCFCRFTQFKKFNLDRHMRNKHPHLYIVEDDTKKKMLDIYVARYEENVTPGMIASVPSQGNEQMAATILQVTAAQVESLLGEAELCSLHLHPMMEGDDLLECQLGEEEAAEVHVKKESLHL